MELVLELKVKAKQEDLVNYVMNWNERLSEEFVHKDIGVWESVGTYQSQQDQDKKAIKELQKFLTSRLKKFGITDYKLEVKEVGGIRFVQCVKIDGNVSDIMNIDCVRSCKKMVMKNGESLFAYKLYPLMMAHPNPHREAVSGDWLCQDSNRKWHILTETEYKEKSYDLRSYNS